MSVGNRVASMVGLKDLGSLVQVDPDKVPEHYQVGDRIGIFSILHLPDREVILTHSDKHLDVKASFFKVVGLERPKVVVSTVVHIHNLLGRAYMLFVGPAHKIIIPSVLKRSIHPHA